MGGDRGSISVALVGALAVALGMLMFLTDLGLLVVARARAQTAADAAALAAAGELAGGGADPREKAEMFARGNGGRLIRCDCSPGSEIEASVVVLVPVRLGGMRLVGVEGVTARARAKATPSFWETGSSAESGEGVKQIER